MLLLHLEHGGGALQHLMVKMSITTTNTKNTKLKVTCSAQVAHLIVCATHVQKASAV